MFEEDEVAAVEYGAEQDVDGHDAAVNLLREDDALRAAAARATAAAALEVSEAATIAVRLVWFLFLR